MTQKQFLAELDRQLSLLNISDKDEIMMEYEQHFGFKLADGYTEEEIIVKLDTPNIIAQQFSGSEEKMKTDGAKKVLAISWLVCCDTMTAIFGVFLLAWVAVMAAAAMSLSALAVCLLGQLNYHSLIPDMPYWCAALYGVSFAALAVLTVIGGVYFTAFIRQLFRAYKRFHINIYTRSFKGLTLPSLAIHPQIPVRVNRRMRTVALISLMVFAVAFVGGLTASMLSAGAFEFWHVWQWFQ